MTSFFAQHAGLIELGLVEGIVVAFACYELWSVRRSLRASRAQRAADAAGQPSQDALASVAPSEPAEPGGKSLH